MRMDEGGAMSDNVTRYELEQGRSHDWAAALMKADRLSDYVLYADFARVEDERDRLKARVARLETALTIAGVPIPHEES